MKNFKAQAQAQRNSSNATTTPVSSATERYLVKKYEVKLNEKKTIFVKSLDGIEKWSAQYPQMMITPITVKMASKG